MISSCSENRPRSKRSHPRTCSERRGCHTCCREPARQRGQPHLSPQGSVRNATRYAPVAPSPRSRCGCRLRTDARRSHGSRQQARQPRHPTTVSGIMLRACQSCDRRRRATGEISTTDLSTKPQRPSNSACVVRAASRARVARFVPGGARRRTRTIASDATYAVTGKRIVSRGTAASGGASGSRIADPVAGRQDAFSRIVELVRGSRLAPTGTTGERAPAPASTDGRSECVVTSAYPHEHDVHSTG